MRYVQLEVLVGGTQFEYQGKPYEKTITSKGDMVLCYPVLGGKVQPGIEDWLPRTAEVKVK
jgi:hypothetical protein